MIYTIIPIVMFSCMSLLLLIVGLATFFEGTRFKANKRAALAYDLSKAVAAHVARTDCSLTYAQRMDLEFRRWFVVAAASPVLIGMTSQAVDEYWHTLLTVDGGRLYHAFSEAVAGRQVRHVEGVGSDDLAARAWVAYETVWGVTPPLDLFTSPSNEAIERYRKHVRETSASASDGGDGGINFISLDFGSSCSGDSGHGGDSSSHGGDGGGHGCGGGGDGGGCGGGGE